MKNPNKNISNLNGLDILVLSPTPTYPLDYGNRKRIFSSCEQLRQRGARIHFVHYPFEWRARIPQDAIQQMSQQWYSFHLIPLTRPSHQSAQGEDHTIDEWWDDAIGNYLQWLFQNQYFDAFIVNYTYLSKAFEFAPQHTFKILDTHDKFTERRQLLATQGISAEFFHTTKEQEKIALDRADLVWAIKDEEAEFFRTITTTPVSTMPHIEPRKLIAKTDIPSDKDYTVLGLIGARNSINIWNTRNFLNQVLPKFRRHLAPIKIKLAGSMCLDLEDLQTTSGVELMGRVEHIEDFYAAIDVALIPMIFSTGLKIKAVEALASGLPIIAHKHAMEGIPTNYASHLCNDFDEIAEYCLEIAYNKSKLLDMANGTRQTYSKMKQQVEQALDKTATKIVSDKSLLVIVLNQSFFDRESLINQSIIQTIYYLKWLSKIVFYVDTPLNRKQIAALEYHDLLGKVVLSPQAAQGSDIIRQDQQEYINQASGFSFAIASLAEFCQPRNITCLWLFDIPQELKNNIPQSLREIPTYIRTDVIKTCYQQLEKYQENLQLLQNFRNLKLVSCSATDLSQDSNLVPLADRFLVPFWRESPEFIRHLGKEKSLEEKPIIIVTVAAYLSWAYSIWNVCKNLFSEQTSFLVFCVEEIEDITNNCSPNKVNHPWQKDNQFLNATANISELINNYQQWNQSPRFVIDLTREHPSLAIYRETLKRTGTLTIIPDGGFGGSNNSLIRVNEPLKPVSAFALIETLTRLAMEENYATELGEQLMQSAGFEYANDAGWAKIWKSIQRHQQVKNLAIELELSY